MKVNIKIQNQDVDTYTPDIETIVLTKGYVTDSIGDSWKFWTPYRAVIIHCQTGEGKTTFIEDVLVKDAIAKGKKILIVSNRLSQSLANKKRIIEEYDIENIWSDEGLRKHSFFGSHIVILTYQKLYNILSKIDTNSFEYIIMDEVHYFMSDATFSPITGYLLSRIPQKFCNSKRVYVSATPEEVLPHIIKAETSRSLANRYRLQHILSGTCYKIENIFDGDQRCSCVREMMYAPNSPMPILYQSKENYKFLDLHFFEDFEEVKKIILESNDKWIVFVTSKEFGQELHKEFEDSIYLDADTKEQKPTLFADIIDKECFESKVLICTSVFINGNNIKDDKVRNIVVFHDNPCDIKQAIGRKRIADKNKEKVNVYLYIPKISEITYKINENLSILEDHHLSTENPKEFSRKILSDDAKRKQLINKLYVNEDGQYYFNSLSIAKIRKDNAYLNEIKELIAKSKVSYCRFMAKIFSLPFKRSMCDLLIDGRAIIEEKLASAAKKSSFTKEEFLELSKEISELRRKYGMISKSDNFGENRQPLDYSAFNSRLEEFNFAYKVHKVEENYFILKL